ncbi:MAG: DarT ssDNA thymidine ADP-ribosyltransferase family protein [Prevotellaceae bacterium]|jgi:hypothetical protein|nr:DarT ssDNA thymidine ADP-ribosyltransferase family protein [Prevotellaceae bacterium]
MNLIKRTWNKIKILLKWSIAPSALIIWRNPNAIDIHKLEIQKKKLLEELKAIKAIKNPDVSVIEESLKKLNQINKKKIMFVKVSNRIMIPKSTQYFENILKENSLLKQFNDKELERKRIKEILTQIEISLDIDKLDYAKLLIAQIQIKSSYTHEIIERLEKAKQKLQDREFQILKDIQKEEQKRQDERAKLLRDIEENRQKELSQKREAEAREKRIKEEKERQGQNKLEILLVKKKNWEAFKQVLVQNGITTLYHFTDKANINSIKKHKGLFSWNYCDHNGINIPCPGGDSLSRQLDMRYNLQDYVRLSFCDDHPMMFRLQQNNRDLVLLKVKIDVVYFEQTQFSNINATDKEHTHGSALCDLQRIDFQATQKHYVSNVDIDFKPHQAEVLVKTWIPIDYITNINDFDL